MKLEKDLSWNKIVVWIFYAAVTFILTKASNSLDRMENSVADLNVKIATVVEKTANHEKQLERQDERIRHLETVPRK